MKYKSEKVQPGYTSMISRKIPIEFRDDLKKVLLKVNAGKVKKEQTGLYDHIIELAIIGHLALHSEHGKTLYELASMQYKDIENYLFKNNIINIF